MLIEFLINEDNYQLYAAKAYQKTAVLSTEEFLLELKSLERLKSDITRWNHDREDKQLRLIINKVVIFCNTFGQLAAIKMIIWKNRNDPYTNDFIKTLFVFLGISTEFALPISKDITVDFTKFNTNKELIIALEDIFK